MYSCTYAYRPIYTYIHFAGGDTNEKEQRRGQQQKELLAFLKRYIIQHLIQLFTPTTDNINLLNNQEIRKSLC